MSKNKDSIRHKLRRSIKKILVVNAHKIGSSVMSASVPETVSDEQSTLNAAKLEEDYDILKFYENLAQQEEECQLHSECSSVYSQTTTELDMRVHESDRLAKEYIALIGSFQTFKGYGYCDIPVEDSAKVKRVTQGSKMAQTSTVDLKEEDASSQPELKRDGCHGYSPESSWTHANAQQNSTYESQGSYQGSYISSTDEDVGYISADSATSISQASSYTISEYRWYHNRPETDYNLHRKLLWSHKGDSEEDIQATRNTVQYEKQAALPSSRNIIHPPQTVYRIGSPALANPSRHFNRLYRTQATINLTEQQNRGAQHQLQDLGRLSGISNSNWEQFLVTHALSPSTTSSRSHDSETRQSDFIRARAWKEALHSASIPSTLVQQPHHFHAHLDPSFHRRSPLPRASSRSESVRLQFEPDSGDQIVEGEVEGNREGPVGQARQVSGTASAMGEEAQGKEGLLGRSAREVNGVHYGVAENLARMEGMEGFI